MSNFPAHWPNKPDPNTIAIISTNSTSNIKINNMATYRVGEAYYYLGRTLCTVEAETLRPGDGNLDEALIQIRLSNGAPIVILYKTADKYLLKAKVKTGFFQLFKSVPAKNV